jgi:hypothetical protein
MVEYSRVNPLNAHDIREDFSWRRMVNLADENLQCLNDWEEFTPDKSFLASELKVQVEDYPPFL